MWTPSPSLLLPSWLHAEFNSIVRVIQDHNLQWGSTALMALKRIKLIVLAPEGIFLPQPRFLHSCERMLTLPHSLAIGYELLSSLHGATDQRTVEVYTQVTLLSNLQLHGTGLHFIVHL